MTKDAKQTRATPKSYRGNINQHKHPAMRWLFLLLGWLFFGLGVIGALLPVMPTAPFILLAATCWARGSERFYIWLINHEYMGKYVRDWEARRAVPRRAKWLACIMMAISGTMLFFTVPDGQVWIAWVVASICTGVGIYLWRLPNA